MKEFVISGILVLGLASCATMSKEECLQMDWRVAGVKDASAGKPLQPHFENYSKACAKANIVPDQQQYELGRIAGLKTYCTTQNGYKEGIKGRQYYGVCDEKTEMDFNKGYKIGKELYGYESATYEARDQLRSLRKSKEKTEAEIKSAEKQALSGEAGSADQIAEALASMRARKIELEQKMAIKEEELKQKRAIYDEMKRNHARMNFCSAETCFK